MSKTFFQGGRNFFLGVASPPATPGYGPASWCFLMKTIAENVKFWNFFFQLAGSTWAKVMLVRLRHDCCNWKCKSMHETKFNESTESLQYKSGNDAISKLFTPCGEKME